MQKALLKIVDLLAVAEDKKILKELKLVVKAGEFHAIMGPNGSGKSTLAQVLAGNPVYQVEGGKMLVNGEDTVDLKPEDRAKLGVFVSFQHPPEIPGVNVSSYLRMIYNKKFGQNLSPVKFRELLTERMKVIDMSPEFAGRYLNEGFSGGEKKKMELLQMLVLEPRLVILDEIDSGLDIDALKCVAAGITWLRRKNLETAFIIITHHARILDHVKPDFVHIMRDGKIVKTGSFELAQQLEQTGYKEFGEERPTA